MNVRQLSVVFTIISHLSFHLHHPFIEYAIVYTKVPSIENIIQKITKIKVLLQKVSFNRTFREIQPIAKTHYFVVFLRFAFVFPNLLCLAPIIIPIKLPEKIQI